MKLYDLTIAVLALLIMGISTAGAFPGQTSACNSDGCHTLSPSIIVTTNVTSTLTVSPGQAFSVGITYSGGLSTGRTEVNWPNVHNNTLFNPTLRVPVPASAAQNGITSSVLTAPTAPGPYFVTVYTSSGAAATGPDGTNFSDISVTVQPSILNTIKVSPATATVTAGNNQVFNATALDQNGNPMEGINITWTSNDTAVGTIAPENVLTGADGNATATFTAITAGTAMVNATNASFMGSVIVTAVKVPVALGSIIGMKFNDVNRNGMKDPGESGLANWTIVLKNSEGSIMETMMTDHNGNYTFGGLAAGNYTVEEVLKADWAQTFPEASGTYNVTLADGEDITGKDFGNNLREIPTSVVNATWKIENESLRMGESTNITIIINSDMVQALAIQEFIPTGWNLKRISDDVDGFKNSTNEWTWSNVTPGITKTVIYSITAPADAAIGTYFINGTISNSSGVISIIGGNNMIALDIFAYYRRLGSDPNGLETTDLLKAMDDWRNKMAPVGFDQPITNQELSALIIEWLNATPSPTPKVTNIIPLHLNAASVSSEKCKECHKVLDETSLKPDIQTSHVVHLTSGQLKFECNSCHKSVDLNEISAASLRRQVDPAFCAKCHSPFSTKMDAANKDKDCTMCHSNWKVKMANATFVNLEVLTSKDCFGCHGGRAWYIGGNTS